MTAPFKRLVKGNDVSSIIQAIKYLQPKVRNKLMEEFNTTSIEDLAKKLQ